MAGHGKNGLSGQFDLVENDLDREHAILARLPEYIRHYLLVESNVDVSAVSMYDAVMGDIEAFINGPDWDRALINLKFMSRQAHVAAFGNEIPERIYHGRYDKIGRLKGQSGPRSAVRRQAGGND